MSADLIITKYEINKIPKCTPFYHEMFNIASALGAPFRSRWGDYVSPRPPRREGLLAFGACNFPDSRTIWILTSAKISDTTHLEIASGCLLLKLSLATPLYSSLSLVNGRGVVHLLWLLNDSSWVSALQYLLLFCQYQLL